MKKCVNSKTVKTFKAIRHQLFPVTVLPDPQL